jgi:hypothetical protein
MARVYSYRLEAWESEYVLQKLPPFSSPVISLLPTIKERILWKYLFSGQHFLLQEVEFLLEKFTGKAAKTNSHIEKSLERTSKPTINQKNSAKAMGLKVLQKLNLNRSSTSIVSV